MSDRLLTGVAGGVGEWLGIRPIYIRAAFLSAILAAGFGLIVYVLAALLVPEAEDRHDPSKTTTQQKLGIAVMFAAGMFLFQGVGLWFGAVTWPIVLVLFGLAIALDTSGFNYDEYLKGVMRTS